MRYFFEVNMAGRGGWLERMSRAATDWSGSSLAFALALGTIIVWLITGPIFHFSDTWQLVINTGTSVLTFLMVFLIQRSQNKDSAAIHMKLNEVVASLPWASNRLISVEDMTEEEVKILRHHFRRLVELAKKDEDLKRSHSIEDADADHARKRQKQRRQLTKSEPRQKRHRKSRRPNPPDVQTVPGPLPELEPPPKPT
jgi:low affinity Fe/Cu permease